MTRRCLAALLLLVTAASCLADRADWVSFKIKGVKVGYSCYSSSLEDGVVVQKTREVFNTKLLGQPLEIDLKSTSRLRADGQVDTTATTIVSGGRTVKIRTHREGRDFIAEVEGEAKPVRLKVPDQGFVADDPAFEFFAGRMPRATYLSFDPENLSLVPSTTKSKGRTTLDTPLGKTSVEQIEVADSRATTVYYLGSKGELVRADGPFGIQMEPTTEEDATTGLGGESDLATASRIDVGDVDGWLIGAKTSSWKVTGATIRIQQDAHQSVVVQGGVQELTVHPARKPNRSTKIPAAGIGMEEWLLPEPRIPSDDPGMRSEAERMTGDEQRVWAAAQRIREAVHRKLNVNAGIGVLRDAREVWQSSEGVCRDHAVLMATLLRAVKIPTRLVSGLVYESGALYYHAWVEVWDGRQWFGVDSTRPQEFLTAGHVKTAQGHLSEATGSFLLSGAKFEFQRGG